MGIGSGRNSRRLYDRHSTSSAGGEFGSVLGSGDPYSIARSTIDEAPADYADDFAVSGTNGFVGVSGGFGTVGAGGRHSSGSSNNSGAPGGIAPLGLTSIMRTGTPIDDTIASANWSLGVGMLPTTQQPPLLSERTTSRAPITSERTTSLGVVPLASLGSPSDLHPRIGIRTSSNAAVASILAGSSLDGGVPLGPSALRIALAAPSSRPTSPGLGPIQPPASPNISPAQASTPSRTASSSVTTLASATAGLTPSVALHPQLSVPLGHPSPGWAHVGSIPPHNGTSYATSDYSDDGEYDANDPRSRAGTGGLPHKEKGKIPESVDLEAIKDIPSWLRSLRLHKYTPIFENDDWRTMVKLSEEDLIKRGVAALGARRKMIKVFELVRKELEAKLIAAKSLESCENAENNVLVRRRTGPKWDD
eukprot:jgi/Hompol1/3132/HPOL_006363-RA